MTGDPVPGDNDARERAAREGPRDGRGRLSSIDLLPEEAEEDVVWALEELRARRHHQSTILAEFNLRLADKGIAPISKSAWNRFAVRKAIQFRRLDEVQRISGELVGALGTDGPDQLTVAVAEMLKLAMFEKLEGGMADTKSMMELGRALSSAVGAQKASAEHRRKLQDEMLAKVDRAIEKAGAETAGNDGADAQAVLKRIREDVYGIFTQ